MILGLSFVCCILIIVVIALCFMLRGATLSKSEDIESYVITRLTGVDIEKIRRDIINVGMNALTTHDVLNLIYVVRSIQLGTYTDENPYVSQHPYDGFLTLEEYDKQFNRV